MDRRFFSGAQTILSGNSDSVLNMKFLYLKDDTNEKITFGQRQTTAFDFMHTRSSYFYLAHNRSSENFASKLTSLRINCVEKVFTGYRYNY